MRINKVKFLKGYNCIKKDTVIDFSGTGNYCALVGRNGSGKTSVIYRIFHCFRINYYPVLPIYKLIAIGNEDNNLNDFFRKTPKLVIFNYSGDTIQGTNFEVNNIETLLADYHLLSFAAFFFNVVDDPIVDICNIKNPSIANLLEKAKKQYHVSNTLNYNVLKYILKELEINDIGDENTFNVIGIKKFMRFVLTSYIRIHKTEDFIFHKFENNNYWLLSLNEANKKLLILKLIMYIADEDTLVLLDEPDAYYDIQRKRELFEMIKSCKGQVILTTHDPIMTKWMKGHLVFMKDGKQIPSNLVNAINEISEGEVSYQETLLMLSECKHFVFVEGKTDIAFIRKAIEKLDYSHRFENITFLTMGSSGAVEDKYYTTICELLPKDTKKILFLFDADAAGYDGKKQIDDLKALKNENIDDLLKEKQECRDGNHIQKMDEKITKIQETDFDLLDKITYYFYNENDDFSAKQDGDRLEWFYLEDYFNVNTYPDEYKVRKKEIKEYFKGLIPENDNENDDILKFRELEAFGQRCKNQKFSNNVSRIKNFFKDKLYLINDPSDFEPFRPLLDKILEKLELA